MNPEFARDRILFELQQKMAALQEWVCIVHPRMTLNEQVYDIMQVTMNSTWNTRKLMCIFNISILLLSN